MKVRPNYADRALGGLIAWCLLMLAALMLRDGSGNPRLLILVGTLLGFLGIALRFNQENKIRVALALSSFLIPLYLVEVFFFFQLSGAFPDAFVQLEHRAMAAQKYGQTTFDLRSKVQVVEDLRREGIDAFPSSGPSLFLGSNGLPSRETPDATILPLAGISNKATVLCNETGTWSVYESDEHGFNNPKGLYDHPQWDVALIGDSFTHGACVNPGEDVGSQLRKRRGPQEVVASLGSWGNGPLLELATLKEYARPFKPRAVFWLYYEHNDLAARDVLMEAHTALLKQYLEERAFSQRLLARQAEIDSALATYIAEAQRKLEGQEEQDASEGSQDEITLADWKGIPNFYHLRSMLRDLRTKLSLSGYFGERNHAWLRRTLVEAKDEVASWDGTLYFVYLPTWKRYTRFVNQDNLYDRRKVLALVEELGIPVVDFHETIAADPDPQSFFPFHIHAHYTPEGYRRLAEQLDKALSDGATD